MVWKAGCITILIGIIATVGSCALFGTAVDRAMERRQVYDRAVKPGNAATTADVDVDPDASFELRVEVNLALGDAALAKERESGEIVAGEVPVGFVVHDSEGSQIAQGAGRARGTVIVPADSHPSRAGFAEKIDCAFTSPKFRSSPSGRIMVTLDVPPQSDDGADVLSARLIVFDRIAGTAGRWALSGLLSMLLGPAVITIGAVVFLIGLLMRANSSKSARTNA